MILKEKDKEIRLLQNLDLSRQKEMENLNRKISQREKNIKSLEREKQMLIFNKNYLQSVQQEWINILLKELQKKYRLEVERAMKEYTQKNQEVIPINNPRFVYFVQALKEDIFKEYQGKMQDLETEISEVFDKEKWAIHQDIYDSVSERFRQEQILKQRQKEEELEQKIRRGRRF